MLKRKLAILCVAWTLSQQTFAVAAKRIHSPDAIAASVEEFLQNYPFETVYPVDFKVNRISNRLRLSYCKEALEIDFSPNAKRYGKTHLRLQCPSGKKWRINIGVELNVFHDTVLSKHAMRRGIVVAAEDLLLKKLPRSKIFSDFYSKKSDVIGLVTTMPVRAEQLLSGRLVSVADVVSKGQSVMVIARAAGIDISTRGKALNHAKRGELVRVQNKDSGRIVEGIAVDPGKVEIPL